MEVSGRHRSNIATSSGAVSRAPPLTRKFKCVPLTPSYRPLSITLRAAGLPAPGETTWYHDHTDGHYRQLATAVGKPAPSSASEPLRL